MEKIYYEYNIGLYIIWILITLAFGVIYFEDRFSSIQDEKTLRLKKIKQFNTYNYHLIAALYVGAYNVFFGLLVLGIGMLIRVYVYRKAPILIQDVEYNIFYRKLFIFFAKGKWALAERIFESLLACIIIVTVLFAIKIFGLSFILTQQRY